MFKQFNIKSKIFDEPLAVRTEDGGYTFETSGDDWFPVNSQEEVNSIWLSVTGGGEVWVENGVIKYSGAAPTEYHFFDMKTKKFKESQEKKNNFLTSKKEALLTSLADKADKIKNSLLVGYPQTEIESFYRQEKEALAWQVNNKADTPMLKQIARIRNIPFEVLVQKVIEKSEQFALAVGVIIGQRQAFEDKLLTLDTVDDLIKLEKEIEEWKFQVN
jgi:hypothetical protein